MADKITIQISELDLEITKGTINKIINALPDNSLTKSVFKMTNEALDKILVESD